MSTEALTNIKAQPFAHLWSVAVTHVHDTNSNNSRQHESNNAIATDTDEGERAGESERRKKNLTHLEIALNF